MYKNWSYMIWYDTFVPLGPWRPCTPSSPVHLHVLQHSLEATSSYKKLKIKRSVAIYTFLHKSLLYFGVFNHIQHGYLSLLKANIRWNQVWLLLSSLFWIRLNASALHTDNSFWYQKSSIDFFLFRAEGCTPHKELSIYIHGMFKLPQI